MQRRAYLRHEKDWASEKKHYTFRVSYGEPSRHPLSDYEKQVTDDDYDGAEPNGLVVRRDPRNGAEILRYVFGESSASDSHRRQRRLRS